MPPKRPIPVLQQDFAAATALCNQMNVVAPGKYTVGVGLKQIGREFTDRVALFVCVPEKMSAEDVPEGEFVPPEFYGYVTDVIVQQPVLAADVTRYDPLHGGIQISKPGITVDGLTTINPGTLGAIVRRRQDGSLLLLTNAHVAAALNVDIFQPAQGEIGAAIVGTVIDLRDEGSPLLLDCAVIRPNSSRSLQNTIQDIGPVRGVSTGIPALGELVKKRGARTLLTQGFVVRLWPGAVPAVSEIEVSGSVPFVTLFAGKGDSGSVLLNTSDQVIGLLFAMTIENLGPGLSSGGFFMPINNVHEALQVDVVAGV